MFKNKKELLIAKRQRLFQIILKTKWFGNLIFHKPLPDQGTGQGVLRICRWRNGLFFSQMVHADISVPFLHRYKFFQMTSRQSVLIRSTPDIIFAFMMEVENRKLYIPALEEIILLDEPPIREGSRYIEVANIGGRRLETTYQVTEFEENKYIVAKTLKSIFPIQAGLYLEKKENGTQLIINLDFELKGIFQLAAPVVKGIVNQQAFEIVSKIKENIETQ